jgi:hypothetical protein
LIGGFSNGGGFTINMPVTMNNCHFESTNNGHSLNVIGSNFNNNRFWSNTAQGFLRFLTMIDCNLYRNIFDNVSIAIGFFNSGVNTAGVEDIYGPLITNTSDLDFVAAPYTQFMEVNSPSNYIVNTVLNSIALAQIGSLFRQAGYNGNPNDNKTIAKFGETQSCGTGLTDTTVRTAGGFSLRMMPTNGTSLLLYPQKVSERSIPTGNIQNKTMTVSAWVYIANSAYSTGVHIKPTLSVKFDNATTQSAVAVATYGAWQLLAVIFTPITTYGQINVWFSSATDATTTNRYWYLDDINVAYPAGVQVNLGGLDLYADALPIYPPIATMPSLGGVWDEAISAHNISGSFGQQANKTKKIVTSLQ